MTTSIGLAATLVLAAQTASSWECTRVTWCGDLVVGGGGHTVVAGNLGREPIRIQIDGIVRDLAADAGRVAVACDWAGVRIFDPELGPRSIATIPTSDAALSVDLSERLLAIAEATAGVSLHDLHNASPILLRR
ncbi:MAG: hypothetical protein CME06_13250, partial [Gemmatimonadetes bacterium]|nr:hypothetical protein [Gemmatimonadota bacterium]